MSRCSLLMVDGHFICLGEDGTLRLLKVNPKKYEEVSKLVLRDPKAAGENAAPLLKSPCWAAPILAHGLLYVRGEGRLDAPRTGWAEPGAPSTAGAGAESAR